MNMHPLKSILSWLPELDFAVVWHSFTDYGRDYQIIIEDCHGSDPGQHKLTFTHCVHAFVESRVRDDVWPVSWGDEFIDYDKWVTAGEPGGYVWGTKWSLAYPGIEAVEESPIAKEWSDRLGKNMYEITLETDRFFLRLIFHSIKSEKIGDDTSTISQITVPLKGSS
jgi:hypothetical protein